MGMTLLPPSVVGESAQICATNIFEPDGKDPQLRKYGPQIVF